MGSTPSRPPGRRRTYTRSAEPARSRTAARQLKITTDRAPPTTDRPARTCRWKELLMATVTYDHATRIYPGGDKPAVDSLNLDIQDGEFLVLVGPSGCG